MKTSASIWASTGKDKNYEAYRTAQQFQQLRDWVDEAYTVQGLSQFLDRDFLNGFRDRDFYGRLWELEVSESLANTGPEMIQTKIEGPDFCLKLNNDSKIWVEAVLSRVDESLNQKYRSILTEKEVKAHEVPRKEIALRYTSSLFDKSKKIKKYKKLIGESDYVLIAISGYSMPSMWSDIDLFIPAILPIGNRKIYFSKDGSPLDKDIIRPTHTDEKAYQKATGAEVPKEFLFPGSDHSHIDGVMFSEASNLQQLLGRYSSGFDDSTNRPHIFSNYSGKELPSGFTKKFYNHKSSIAGEFLRIDIVPPR